MKLEMFVGLTIPDSTASTALRALQKMLPEIKSLVREDYYRFEIEGDLDATIDRLGKADILVNANKNTCRIKKQGGSEGPNGSGIKVLVQNTNNSPAELSKNANQIGRGYVFFRLFIIILYVESKKYRLGYKPWEVVWTVAERRAQINPLLTRSPLVTLIYILKYFCD